MNIVIEDDKGRKLLVEAHESSITLTILKNGRCREFELGLAETDESNDDYERKLKPLKDISTALQAVIEKIEGYLK